MKKRKINFLSTTKYEFVRIFRNKLILFLLLAFCVVFLLIVSTADISSPSYSVAMFTDSVEESKVEEFLSGNIPQDSIVYVDSIEQGQDMLKNRKVKFFISLNNDTPVTATIYHDSSDIVSNQIVEKMRSNQNNFMYQSLLDYIGEYGIKINEKYFDLISFKACTDLSFWQVPFSLQIAACISVVIMFGLAYSIARDNETNVSRNLNYLPLGANKHLISKFVPYFCLGAIETVFVFLFGYFRFKIFYSVNPIILFLTAMLFVVATINLSFIFSMLKSQIATTLLSTFVILLPTFALSYAYVESYPIVFQIILYCMPILPFVNLNNSLMFNGVFLFDQALIIIAQIVVYYLIAVLLLRHKSRI